VTANCIFCAILSGAAPASRVYEDEHILAFMDTRPVRAGQVLVVPKQHIDHFCDLPDELATRVLLLGQRLARALQAEHQPARVGMVVHGFGVPHAHLIVLPLHHAWDITSAANAYLDNGQIKFRWEQLPLTPRAELEALAGQLSARLAGSS